MNQENHQELLAAVDRFHRRWRQVRTLIGMARLLLVTVVLAACCSIIDYHAELGLMARLSLTTVFYTVIGIAAVFLVVLPLVRRLPSTKLAWMIEKRHPELREILASTLALTAGSKDHVSSDMLDHVLADCREKVCRLQPRNTFPLTLQMFSVELAVIGLFCIAMSIPSLQFPELFLRVAIPSDHQPGIGAFQLQFRNPVKDQMTEGARTSFEVVTDNTGLQSITLYFKFPDGRIEQETVTRRDQHEPFVFLTEGFYDSVVYWAKAGKVSTSKRRMTIRKRPKILSFFIRHFPPAHAELPPIDIKSTSGDLQALANTTIELTITATKPLSSMEIERGGEALPVELSPDRRKGFCSFLVDRSGHYTVRMRDASGLGSPAGMDYTVTMIPDTAPEVTVVQPKSEIFTEARGSVQLNWHARDDFGIAHQEVQCSVLGGASYTFPMSPDATSFGLELGQLSLDIGDELLITIHALDATRQPGVSTPVRAFILDTSEFNNANRFRGLLSAVKVDLEESQLRLKGVENSIQAVILGQSTNIKQNADLGHHLTMLSHRVERLDRQLILVNSHIPALEEMAFFPYCHQLFRDIDLAIGEQLIFGQYHSRQSIKAVQKGQRECQQVIIHCLRAVQLLEDFANRWLVDTIGSTTLAALRSETIKTSKQETVRAFYNSKIRLCRSILPDPDIDSLMLPDDAGKTSPGALAKRLRHYLAKNAKSIHDFSSLEAEVKEFRRLSKSLYPRLLGYAPTFAKEDPLDRWSASRRFRAYLQVQKQVSAEKAADRALLNAILLEAEQRQSQELFSLAAQALRRMDYYYYTLLLSQKSESFHQYMGNLLMTKGVSGELTLAFLGTQRPEHAVGLRDELLLIGSLPFKRIGSRRNRGRFDEIAKRLRSFRSSLDGPQPKGASPYKLDSVYTFSKDTREFFQKLLESDLRWRNLMKKAVNKKLPSQSQKLGALNLKLGSAINNGPVTSDLERIIRDLYNFANRLEKTAVNESLRQGGGASETELQLGLAYSIYDILSNLLSPALQQLTQAQGSSQSSLPLPSLAPADRLQTALGKLEGLALILAEQEASSFGLRSLDQEHELRVNIREETQRIFSPELIGQLSFFDHANSTHERLTRLSASIPDSNLEALPTLPLIGEQCRRISQESFDILQAIAPSSLRAIIREYALQALKGLTDLRNTMILSITPETYQSLAAQATFAELNLRFAEDISELAGLPEVHLPLNMRENIISKLSGTNSPLSPEEQSEVIKSVDDAIRSAKELADRALLAPQGEEPPVGEPTFVLPEDTRRDVLHALVSIRHTLLYIEGQIRIKNDLKKEKKGLSADYRRALGKLKKRSGKPTSVNAVIDSLLMNVKNTPVETQFKELDALFNQHKVPASEQAEIRRLFSNQLIQLPQRILDLETLIRKSVDNIRKLTASVKAILHLYSGNRGGTLCLELVNHLSDSMDLSDFGQASLNLEALTRSVSNPVPPRLAMPIVITTKPEETVDIDFLETLPVNPFSIRAIIEANQDNRLPVSIRQRAAQLISQGAYHSARMILPSNITEILYMAQEGDTFVPKDALPVIFRGDQLEIQATQNTLPPEHFSSLSKLFLLGNQTAIIHYLNGDKQRAFESLTRFSSTLPDEQAVVCNALIAELREREDFGHDFNEITGLPVEAARVTTILLNLRVTDYVFELEHLLVAYLENYRALSFLVNRQYREAANAAYGLLELMPGYPSEDLETGLLHLVELDLKLYPSEDKLVRQAMRKMPYSVPAVTYAVANGDLRQATSITSRLGMAASTVLFHNASVYLESSLTPSEKQAASYLERAVSASETDAGREVLEAALNYLKTHESAKAYDILKEFIDENSTWHQTLITLINDVKSRDLRLAAVDNALKEAKKGNMPAAISSLNLSPEFTTTVQRLEHANRHLESGMKSSLLASGNQVPFGIQRSLKAAFDAAMNYDLVAAFAAAKRAGEYGKEASISFSKARTELQSAISLLESHQARTLDAPLVDQTVADLLASGIGDTVQRQEAIYLLKQKDYENAVPLIQSGKPAELAAYRAMTLLSAPRRPMTATDMVAILSGPRQEVKYLLRILVNLQRIAEKTESDQTPALLEDCVGLAETIMEGLSTNIQRLFQELQENKSKELVANSHRFMSASQRAWLSRLENGAYRDSAGKRMSIGLSFLRGEKQNYSSYYKEANRHYLNWLLEQSKVRPEKQPTP